MAFLFSTQEQIHNNRQNNTHYYRRHDGKEEHDMHLLNDEYDEEISYQWQNAVGLFFCHGRDSHPSHRSIHSSTLPMKDHIHVTQSSTPSTNEDMTETSFGESGAVGATPAGGGDAGIFTDTGGEGIGLSGNVTNDSAHDASGATGGGAGGGRVEIP
jgi:hypothetical protein